MTDPEARDEIVRVSPAPVEIARDEDRIAEWYAVEDRSIPWVRVNFVSSLDGSATRDGLSAGLSNAADHAVFDVLRRLCDVVVVGAGTVRAEGYGAMRLDDDSARWRTEHGLAAHPVFAVVSARLDLDADSAVFRDAPVRPIVFTGESAPVERRRQLERVADVVSAGESTVEAKLMVDHLIQRGLVQVHCEGGPHLFGSLIVGDRVDELCLTLSPMLEAGFGPRISGGHAPEVQRTLSLAHVLRSGDTLLLRYTRTPSRARTA